MKEFLALDQPSLAEMKDLRMALVEPGQGRVRVWREGSGSLQVWTLERFRQAWSGAWILIEDPKTEADCTKPARQSHRSRALVMH
ncbi:hypothetical protein PE066_14290 [Ramlibacter tataouinensis]|uniref:hypothetical protein n=1 Tax=Ramlibacter tataouinensis TaxID=94132 RepID=UPI0022F39B01|nr:hypothetical protein [Ramlibacter tataouinensis]WBY00631.1 hypothetical protein PE066_14290 [Ramlibacter tataouinensis]